MASGSVAGGALTPSLFELEPMLLAQARSAWSDPAWIAELKADGYRLLVEVEGDRVRLRTRQATDATKWYPELCTSSGLAGLTKTRTVLDGEVVVVDEIGRTDFEKLHARSRRRRWYEGADIVTFFAFDLLILRGKDLRDRPLAERKELLAKLLGTPRNRVLLSQFLPGELAPELYKQAVALKLEGIVMKRLDSPYIGGEPRSDHWFKIKRPNATPAQRFTRDVEL